MIHEVFPPLTETALGSHPYRVVSVAYRKLRPFHGGNTGSNPVGDANKRNHFEDSTSFAARPQTSTYTSFFPSPGESSLTTLLCASRFSLLTA